MKLNKTKTNEKFDCIKMKLEIQAQIYEETKNMTHEERIAHIYIPKEKSIFKHIRND